MNNLLRTEEDVTDEMDELLADIRTRGLEVLKGVPDLAYSAVEPRPVGEPEEIDVSPMQGAVDAANDPVRIYLREMGATPLLTREGEVELAKRIERGQLWTWKALSRSPLVMRDVIAMGADLKRGLRSIKEIVVFNEEETSQEMLQDRAKDVARHIDQVHKHYRASLRLAARMATIPANKNAREYSRC